MKYTGLIARMTLEEKASLMSGLDFWHSKRIERLSIPSMLLTDGPHGLRKQGGKTDSLGLNDSIPATCYPTASGIANTWDPDLIEQMGEHLGLEAASEGVSVILGPGVNMKRSPLCGRNFEYFSEDPYQAGKIAAALIRGIQSNGISACVKHFAANNQELRRMCIDTVVDERTLREIYLPAFETAVKEGGVKCVMSAYNRLDGVFCNENIHLLEEILYKDWGFEGVVVTDWGANNDRVDGLIAGNQLEMPSNYGDTDADIVKAVQEGRLDEAVLDRRVDQLLDLIFTTQECIRKGKTYDRAAHHEFVVKVAEESAVLLKNDDGILPLKEAQRVAVIGDFAKTPRFQGAGSSQINPTKLDNAYSLVRAGVKITGYCPGFKRFGGKSSRLIRQAVRLAKNSDVAVLWLGLDEGSEAEGIDREHMKMPENQIRLLEAVAKVNPNVVVVLSCGSPIEMPWADTAKAILHGYLGGQAGATAVANLLMGKANPSGKLSESYPVSLEDTPTYNYFPGREASIEYREGLYIGYRYYDTAAIAVKYPFGYGLSYTTFEYSDLRCDSEKATFRIKNTGKVAGSEVAQLYVSAKTGGVFRPVKELKGFARVSLEPGESTEVTLTLDERAFSYWNIEKNGWVIESGNYEIMIGVSSRDIRLCATVTRPGEERTNPYGRERFTAYYSADIRNVTDGQFAALIGREIPPTSWDRSKPLEVNDTIAQGVYLKKGLGKTLYGLVNFVHGLLLFLGDIKMANNAMFIMHLPYRGVSRMSNGSVSWKQLMGLMKMVNAEKGGWKEFLEATRAKKKTARNKG
ncbi:glycosyl hydrolase [bacterium]|nr:MAG: glycosyl hydrolase [bacterium]